MNKIIKIERDDERYPELLRMIKDPPKQLYCIGDVSLMKERCAAVVGARKVSSYGRWVAEKTGASLAKFGAVVVSGMAWGADTQAHRGALEAGGRTIAVLGTGPDVCYPGGNRPIYEEICEKGLVISEYPPGSSARPGCFPARNRIISGLSEIVVVCEAGLRSGSLITADLAIEQGRTVFAAPSNINVIAGIGGNKLIQEGAFPLVTVDDPAREMGLIGGSKKTERSEKRALKKTLGKDELEIFEVIERRGDTYIDDLCRELGKEAEDVDPVVSVMEIKGILGSFMGKIFIAK